MLAAIVVIIAIELAHVAIAPAAIMRIFMPRAVGPVRSAGAAGAAIFVAAPGSNRRSMLTITSRDPLTPAIVAGHRAICALSSRSQSRSRLPGPLSSSPGRIVIALRRSRRGH